MKVFITLVALLFPSGCAGMQVPSVEDARAAVMRARQAQAVACLYASRLPEGCLRASEVLHAAEAALSAAQELESALSKPVDTGR